MLIRVTVNRQWAKLTYPIRNFSAQTTDCDNTQKCNVLVVGGGTAGCTMAAKLCSKLGENKVVVLEPNDVHYYQSMFTLIGGGTYKLSDSCRAMKDVLPKKAKWIQDSVACFDPENNKVTTKCGSSIAYDYMVVAMGLQLNFDQIPGLEEALKIPNGRVCSNYSPDYVDRTFQALKQFKGGNLIFTFPNTAIKCPGAPQKILYIAEHYLRKNNLRHCANLEYHTSLGVIFGVKHYADALWKVVKERDIKVHLRSNLIEIMPHENKAVFQNLDNTCENKIIEYDFLHVTPPMSTPNVLHENEELATATGYLNVSKDTLQHLRYPNIFGIGDCTTTPNSKTAAAISAQSAVVYENLISVMNCKEPTKIYDGYASCPLVTGYDSCIMAEFDYNLVPLETFPVAQNIPRYSMYCIKKDLMPHLYWHLFLKGRWSGPAFLRKIMSVFKF